MPANLPPQYYEVERRLREEAVTLEEKIACVEELLAVIPKHKGTDHLRADLRKRLAKLRTAAASPRRTTRQQSAYHIEREGAGRLVLVGPPNVGKSSLVAALTHARPEVSEAPFTTWAPTPGMMTVEDVQIQLLDTPPVAEHVEPEFFDLVKSADLVVPVVDIQGSPLEELEETVAALEARRIGPRHRGGGYPEESRMWLRPFLVLVNKTDAPPFDEDVAVLAALLEEEWPLAPVSAATGRGLDPFRREAFARLEVMRIYTKPPNHPPDMEKPFVLPRGSTVAQFAAKVHHEVAAGLKSARVWGSGAFDGQIVGRDHGLADGDVVELHV
ncbi:MAG: GTPase [Gemmatimonadota bacterium]